MPVVRLAFPVCRRAAFALSALHARFTLAAAKKQGMQTAFVRSTEDSPPSASNPAFDINVATYGELLDTLARSVSLR